MEFSRYLNIRCKFWKCVIFNVIMYLSKNWYSFDSTNGLLDYKVCIITSGQFNQSKFDKFISVSKTDYFWLNYGNSILRVTNKSSKTVCKNNMPNIKVVVHECSCLWKLILVEKYFHLRLVVCAKCVKVDELQLKRYKMKKKL